MNADHTTCLGYHFPCYLITYWENTLMGLNIFLPDIILKPVCKPLWNEDKFLFPAAFGIFEGQSAFINIRRRQLEHLSDPHPAPCHQLEHQAVSWFGCPENNFVNRFFFDDVPIIRRLCPEKLLQHWRVTRIPKILINSETFIVYLPMVLS